MRKPCCKLNKALYGHPESGGHWERHLEAAIKKQGGEPIPNHPSSFWFPADRLFLTVYVDDLLLSGPEGGGAHERFWKALGKTIDIEEPEDLSRFLGRSHIQL